MKLRSLKRNETGQTLMEYVIVTGLIGIFCLLTVRDFGENLKKKIDSSSKKMSKHLNIRSS